MIIPTVNPDPNKFTQVHVLGEASFGGACHEYLITDLDENNPPFGVVHFQKGPVKENGVNGCHPEDLIAIVLHRLQSFQAGDYACRENAMAITKLEEALHWLNHRTAFRVSRNVDGTSEK